VSIGFSDVIYDSGILILKFSMRIIIKAACTPDDFLLFRRIMKRSK
jgi:hypothetical protein